jgi:hydrogenase maturation protein HypF
MIPAAVPDGGPDPDAAGEIIRLRGLVQGVGMRPGVWRLAMDLGLRGDVRNDADGVLIRIWGPACDRRLFLQRLRDEAPPLARIDALEAHPAREGPPLGSGFHILASRAGAAHTGIVPDAAVCPQCLAETADPGNRRFRYPFTNCTQCGPRLSIVRAIPYDRSRTSMADFTLCAECGREYRDPADRRFHAQPNACPVCGPRLALWDAQGRPAAAAECDEIEAARALLAAGRIIAVKGIGGFHLAVDACNAAAVAELRRRKRRGHKPFALMAPDMEVVRRYCHVSAEEEALLRSRAAPIVILKADGPEPLPAAVAPNMATLGFMLPYTPLHHLLMEGLRHPLVLTSGNLAQEPQCIDNEEVRRKLAPLADAFLVHNRAVVNRLDDSVLRMAAGAPRMLRRARGYAPAPLALPAGFAAAPPLLAMGGELKSSFCLVSDGQAVLSQHLGDLENAAASDDYRRSLALYAEMFRHRPRLIAVDAHPDYLSAKLGRVLAATREVSIEAVQHHHAHLASCLAENGVVLDAAPVLGIVFDGLGYGSDGTLWGGEFLLGDYRGFNRLGHLQPAAMIGGVQAIREPWRSTYAHLCAALGWEVFRERYGHIELCRFLARQPLAALDALMRKGINSPAASSCGRLFDAVAAALGVCRERAGYEGQAAIELESCVNDAAMAAAGGGYPFAVIAGAGPALLDPAPMWRALLDDLGRGGDRAVIAARFHAGLARAAVKMARMLAASHAFDTVVLSGGVFQNRLLLEHALTGLEAAGFRVLTQSAVPANDGGLALGQAAVAAARRLADAGGAPPCV